MTQFNPLEGTALLRFRGVYTPAKLFEFNGKIYAKRGSGYVRLLPFSCTSVAKLTWLSITGVEFIEHGGDVLILRTQLTAA